MSTRRLRRLASTLLALAVLVLAVGVLAQLAMGALGMASLFFWVAASSATGGALAPQAMTADIPDILPGVVAASGALLAGAVACVAILLGRRSAGRRGA